MTITVGGGWQNLVQEMTMGDAAAKRIRPADAGGPR